MMTKNRSASISLVSLVLVILLLLSGCINLGQQTPTANAPGATPTAVSQAVPSPTATTQVIATAAATPTFAAATATAPAVAASPTVTTSRWVGMPGATLTIIHTNDIHGHMLPEKVSAGDRSFETGGIASLAAYIEQIRKDAAGHSLLLDAGDVFQGTYISNVNRGQAMTEFMNMMNYDAIEVGNHEFDWGQDVLSQRVGESKMPWLGANITGTTKLASQLKPYIVKQVNGIRVGIIGVILPTAPSIIKYGNTDGLTFSSDIDTVKKLMPEVRSKADIVIVLSHNGLDNDVKLAEAVPDIDVIVGGHSHTVLENTREVNHTLIVQAGSYSNYIGRLDLQIDPQTKKITAWTRRNEIMPVVSTAVQPDPQVAELVNRYQAVAQQASERVIGETKVALVRGSGHDETLLGDVVTDAMLGADAGGRKADIAIHNNSGGLRADINAGQITFGELYQVLPFDNVLTSMDLKGELLLRILERSINGAGMNLAIAGAQVVYDPSAPTGHRIVSMTINGQPFDPAKTYRVQTIDFLAGGGQGQVEFRDGTNVVYGELTVDVVADYIAKHSPLDPKFDNRIRHK